jgi:hypothetical protein
MGPAVVVDGSTADAAWESAQELVLPLEGTGPAEVRLKAAHDGKRLYLMAVWRDASPSYGRFWKLEPGKRWSSHGGEDAFSVCWSPGAEDRGFREQGCALFCHDGKHENRGEAGVVDFLFWGAQQTNRQRQARDLWLPEGQRLRGDQQGGDGDNLPNADPRFEGPRYAPIWMRADVQRFLMPDNINELLPDWDTRLDPARNVGWEIARDILRPMAGSRADVEAVGRFLKTGWILELARDLKTGNPDDQPLGDPLRPALFAVAVHDGSEGEAHARSGPVELHFVMQE